MLKGSYFYFEIRPCLLRSRKEVYLIHSHFPGDWSFTGCCSCACSAASASRQCSHQRRALLGGSLLVLPAPHCPRCPSAHFQCTASLPFSQKGFCICFTYPLFVFLSPAIKATKFAGNIPILSLCVIYFLRKHTGGHLLFILTSQVQTEDVGFFEQVFFQFSYFACFLLLGFMIVQKYSLTALKFLKARNTWVEGDIK